MRIGILNYGMGNLRSVQKAFERIGVKAEVINEPSAITQADKLVLPGVGHFEKGMHNLKALGFEEAIKEAVLIKRKFVLGICLGMQLLTEFSEEGNVHGLGLVKGQVKHFPKSLLKIPHMGWNSLLLIKKNGHFPDLNNDELVYFVHSYYVICSDRSDVLYQTTYGLDFDAAFEHENILGFQFHPEKSHKVGLKLLQSFIKL